MKWSVIITILICLAFAYRAFANTVSPAGSTLGGITTAQSQLSSGNDGYGNNSSFTTGQYVANEKFTNGGVIIHLSCSNTTGGSCTTAPIFNACVEHSGIETCGTQLACSNTQDAIGSIPSQAENLAWAAGDTIVIKLVAQGSACNAPVFDADLLITTP